MDRQVKYLLPESELPAAWYNIVPDLPSPPPPPLHPGTGQPVGPEDLAPLFPTALIMQEVSGDRYITIPDDVIDVYRLWRPTPLLRARRLERDLGTPARIYCKYEGGSPAGSHKPNTAVPQAYYNAAEGSGGSPPRPGPASGAARCRSPRPSSGWTSRCGWCARPTTRSPTARC
jgi:tryptophan synthase beta chain